MRKDILALLAVIFFGCVPMTVFSFDQWPDTGQDASYTDRPGEDSDHAGPPVSYTKLAVNGTVLPDDAEASDGWIMTRDNVTGLIWEVKQDDGSMHDKTITFEQWELSTYITTMNVDSYGGFSDWRLPTIKELGSLIYSSVNPLIQIHGYYFPGYTNLPFILWSSDDYADPQAAGTWTVNFSDGSVEPGDPSLLTAHVMAVRGEAIHPPLVVDNNDGTATDVISGLMWQKTALNNVDWDTALLYCETLELAGFTDWRLPNTKELMSLIDYTAFDPAVTLQMKSSTHSGNYWTSTTCYDDTAGEAWAFNMKTGATDTVDKDAETAYVRAVRSVADTSGLTVYLPHITGGYPQWDDYLQVDNLGPNAAGYLVTLYDRSGKSYSQNRNVSGLTKELVMIKSIAPLGTDVLAGKVTYEDPELNFRLSQHYTPGGGVAQFRLTDTLKAKIGFFFSDFLPTLSQKGLALTNFGDSSVQVTLEAIGKGAVNGTVNVTLGPREKLLKTYGDLFNLDFSKVETIRATGSNPTLAGVVVSTAPDLGFLLFTPAAPVK